jgi:hypothetical protein
MNTLTVSALLAAGMYGAGVCEAQGSRPEQPDMMIDAATRKEVIERTLQQLDTSYVFPDVAKKMTAAIRKRMASGEYDSITSAEKFATTLTADLQAVSHDRHLRVRYSYEPLPERKKGAEDKPSSQEIEQFRQFCRRTNYGFEKVERLPGNVGYLDLRGFFDPAGGGDTVAGTMNFLANSDALIIDLRQNGGGDPAMIQLICSYLFDGESVHLNDIYWRPDDSTRQFWTLPYVPGKRYVDREVYVLTSKETFSGAEEFTYNLKNLKRATIVGETTGGGANPGGSERINAHFSVFVPMGRAINPITKTNWEGTGVTPDVAVPAEQALKTAQLMALKKLLEKTKDTHTTENLKEALDAAQKELAALKKASGTEREHVGEVIP